MPFLLAIVGLMAPRFLIALLWLLSNWFTGVFATRLWPILGFLIMPFTMLWFSVVHNWYGGTWQTWHIVVLVIAVLCDLGSGRGASKQQ